MLQELTVYGDAHCAQITQLYVGASPNLGGTAVAVACGTRTTEGLQVLGLAALQLVKLFHYFHLASYVNLYLDAHQKTMCKSNIGC